MMRETIMSTSYRSVMARCACCGDLGAGALDRRRFMTLAGAAGLAAAMPFGPTAANDDYEAMVLTCIDPRMVAPTFEYLKGRGMMGKYSHFSIAGAAIGVVAPAFKTWRQAFWDNLSTSIKLHRVPKVIAIDHRDCGAARVAYGAASIANPTVETKTHRAALARFRKQVARRYPKLAVETWLMSLDGSVEMLG
jgi:carbonic anhydrase